MIDVVEEKRRRFRFLHELHRLTEGDEEAGVNRFELAVSLQFGQETVERVVQYLVGEGLIRRQTVAHVGITHRGVVEVEEALSRPDEATRYFPPVNIINIHSVVGSQIQQGTIGGTQSQVQPPPDVGAIRSALTDIRRALSELNLDEQSRKDLEADLATVDAQLVSSRPNRVVVDKCMRSVKSVIESAAGSVVATGLLETLARVLG